jgi:hypothetical protein
MTKRIQPWTDQELQNMRRRLVTEYYQLNRESPKEITCDKCQWAVKSTCVFAYDPYNTDRDCLASK